MLRHFVPQHDRMMPQITEALFPTSANYYPTVRGSKYFSGTAWQYSYNVALYFFSLIQKNYVKIKLRYFL
jgi:hypothetical protein